MEIVVDDPLEIFGNGNHEILEHYALVERVEETKLYLGSLMLETLSSHLHI